jgi:hypothetical protein
MEPEQTPPPAPTNRKKVTPKTKAALWLLLGPTVLIVITLIALVIATTASLGPISDDTLNLCSESDTSMLSTAPLSEDCENQILDSLSAGEQALLTAIVLVGGVGVLAWLPGIIIGAVLLAKKRDTSKPDAS